MRKESIVEEQRKILSGVSFISMRDISESLQLSLHFHMSSYATRDITMHCTSEYIGAQCMSGRSITSKIILLPTTSLSLYTRSWPTLCNYLTCEHMAFRSGPMPKSSSSVKLNRSLIIVSWAYSALHHKLVASRPISWLLAILPLSWFVQHSATSIKGSIPHGHSQVYYCSSGAGYVDLIFDFSVAKAGLQVLWNDMPGMRSNTYHLFRA